MTHKIEKTNKIEYAGFWTRVVAWLIDFLLLSIVAIIWTAITGFDMFTTTGYGVGLFSITHFVIWWLYFSLMESSKHQATLGKLALGIKVVDMHYHKLDFLRATGRYFSKFLSVFTLGIGFIMIGLTDNKQGLHDKIADTLVIKK